MPGLKLTERDVARQVRDFLGPHGWRCLRMNSALVGRPQGGAFRVGEVGMPDYLFLRYFAHPMEPGKFDLRQLWIEVKAPGGRLRPAQVEWAKNEAAQGATVLMVDDIDKFRSWYAEEVGR
jgi:hypothetical protein